MSAITISRQLGSLGEEVAQAVAARLGYRVIARELITEAAQRAGLPELALATIDDLGLLGLKPTKKERRTYQEAVRQIMYEQAEAGEVIIVGRAGQVILSDDPRVLHVKVIAPVGLRAERLAQAQGISLDNALEQVKSSDKTRKKYLKSNYKVRWDDPQLYDVIINTARMSPDEAACLICRAKKQCLPE